MMNHAFVAGATPDFSLSAYYTNNSGTNVNTIFVTGQNGFTGQVNLTITYSSIYYASFSTYVPMNSTLTATSAYLFTSATQPGNYTVVVTGTQGNLSHSISIYYNIRPYGSPWFLIDSTYGLTGPWNILAGTSSVGSIIVTSLNGFAGDVDLQVASFPAGIVPTLDHASVVVQPNSAGVTGLNLTVPGTVPAGYYTVVLSGSSGSISRVTYLDVVVTSGFALKANPTTFTIRQGGRAIFTVTMSSLGFWTGSTGLTAACPSGFTCYFNPPSLTLTDPALTAQSTLIITTSATILPGSYSILISETGADPNPSDFQSTTVTVVVTGPDFTVSVDPISMTFAPGVFGTQNATINLSGIDLFTGYVNTTITISPATSTSPTISPTFDRLQVSPTGPASFEFNVSVTQTTALGPYDINIESTTNMTGGLLSHQAYLKATVGPDINITASPANIIVHQGAAAISTITFHSLNGFAGGLMLEAAPLSVLPPNPTIDFTPTYPILVAGGTNTTAMIVIATSLTGLGTYHITVSASSTVQVGFGWVGEGIPMTITVEGPVTGPDFAITAPQPSDSYLSFDSSATTTVTVTSVNGFSGPVTLRPQSYGLNGNSDPSTLTLTPSGSGTFTLNITIPTPYQIDGYPLWWPWSGQGSLRLIVANATGFAHWVWVNMTVTPFRIVPSPNRLNMIIGQSSTSMITATAYSRFNYTLTMSTSSPRSGPTAALSKTLLNFSTTTGPLSLNASISLPSTAMPGDYVVNITATYRDPKSSWFCTDCGYSLLNYTTPIYVHAAAPSSPPSGSSPAGIFGLQPIEFYTIITTIAVAVAGSAGYLVIRGRRVKHSQTY
jgi:hypothetical protein